MISGLFTLSLFFSPLLSVVRAEVTAPALIIVGALMASEIRYVNWSRLEIVIPSFVTIIMMPLTFSVATGIALGFILYPITMAAMKKHRDVHPIMYILGAVFVLYFIYV